MELSPAAGGGGTIAECRCPPGTAQSPRDALCHKIYTRASCPKGQFFTPVPETSGRSRYYKIHLKVKLKLFSKVFLESEHCTESDCPTDFYYYGIIKITIDQSFLTFFLTFNLIFLKATFENFIIKCIRNPNFQKINITNITNLKIVYFLKLLKF